MKGEALAKILFMVSNISFVLAVVFAILALVLFFKFRILNVMGDLSGKNAKKSIAQMRSQNEKTGNKAYRPSKTNAKRGKLTSTMKDIQSNKPNKKEEDYPETGLIAENKIRNAETEETTLIGAEETTLLEENASRSVKPVGGIEITIIDELMIIHTNEIIR